jgi:serine/threonine protein kinase
MPQAIGTWGRPVAPWNDMMKQRSALPEGTLLDGKHRIVRHIAAGSFGMTYEARDAGLDLRVAVKEYYPADFGVRDDNLTVRPRSQGDGRLFQRLKDSFLREARTLALLRHPSIVRVLSVFEDRGTAYMIMEFEEGRTLKDWFESLDRRPTQAELDRIAMPLLDALELLHGQSYLHRDIAPDNIILRSDGSPVLVDFGAARRVMAEISGTLTGIVKSGYSPQEQYANKPSALGPWSDIYALGATLYHVISGAAPLEATLRILDDQILPVSKLAARYYRPGFLAAIDQALAVHPRQRPQSIAELRAMLRAEAADVAPSPPTLQPKARANRIRPETSGPMPEAAPTSAASGAPVPPTNDDGWSSVPTRLHRPAPGPLRWAGIAGFGMAAVAALVLAGATWST